MTLGVQDVETGVSEPGMLDVYSWRVVVVIVSSLDGGAWAGKNQACQGMGAGEVLSKWLKK